MSDDAPIALFTTDELMAELTTRGFACFCIVAKEPRTHGADADVQYRIRGFADNVRALLDHGLTVINRLEAEQGR